MQKLDLIQLLQDIPDDAEIKCLTRDGFVLDIFDAGYHSVGGFVIHVENPEDEE